MKLASFLTSQGEARIAIVHDRDKKLFDLASGAQAAGENAGHFVDMLALIDSGKIGLDHARRLFERYAQEQTFNHEADNIRLLPPLPRPRQMRDGMLHEMHVRRSMRTIMALRAADFRADGLDLESLPLPELADIYRQIPVFYFTNHLNLAGPESEIIWPSYSRLMDYELELALVMGRTGVNIREEDVSDHVFGYTIFNDFSARDQQALETLGGLGPAKGKSFNGSNVIGPWIVTPDEIGDPSSLAGTVKVNGEIRAATSTAGMLFSFEEVIAYMSQSETIHAGEIIGSGTLAGGCGLEFGRFLQDGDQVELEIEKIGYLRNVVRRPQQS
ncbi:fumarylacetoacetate hydrolase family protein [Devosia sp. A369]